LSDPEIPCDDYARRYLMAKYHARPSAQYRYEHYDPTGPGF